MFARSCETFETTVQWHKSQQLMLVCPFIIASWKPRTTCIHFHYCSFLVLLCFVNLIYVVVRLSCSCCGQCWKERWQCLRKNVFSVSTFHGDITTIKKTVNKPLQNVEQLYPGLPFCLPLYSALFLSSILLRWQCCLTSGTGQTFPSR